MFNVEFYEKANGKSEIFDFLEELRIKLKTNKDARIQYKQIMLQIELLQNIEEGIWELRPGNNRVLYFFFEQNTFVLLHHFRKKTQKTPKREIEKAKLERDDYIARKEYEKWEHGMITKNM